MSLKQIDAKIATFSTNKAKLQALGHEISMMIFRHAAPAAIPDCVGSGDCTRALILSKAMPKSWQVQLQDWFKAYTPIRIVTKNDKCEYDPEYKKLSAEEKLTKWDIEGANATPFYELAEPDMEQKVLDFAALVAMVERISKTIETKIEKGLVAPEDIESAKAIATVVSGLHFNRIKPALEALAPANLNGEGVVEERKAG